MTTVTPPPPPPTTPPANVPRGLPTLTVQTPPPGLAELPAGSRFEGTVVVDGTEGARSTVQIQTQYGTITVQTALPLAKGAELNLILTTLAPHLTLQLAGIDGKAPHIALRAANFLPQTGAPAAGPGAAPAATQGPSAPGPAVPAGLVGTTIPATFVRPAPFLAAPAVGTPGAPFVPGAGTPGVATPVAGTPTPIPGVPVPVPGGATPATPIAPGAAPPPGIPPIVPGTRIAVQVASVVEAGRVAVQTAVTPPSAPAGLAVGQTVSAVVTGVATTGQPVVSTPLGILTLATATPLPRGTELTLEIAEPPSAASAAAARPPLHPFALHRAQGWPALEESLQALQEASPQIHDTVTAALPQANSRLTANMLFFLSALRGGDVSSWLGDQAVRVLSRDRPRLLMRLGEEFRHISTLAREPSAPGDWRIALVPFFHQQEIEQLRLYLKPYGGGEEDDAAPQGTRFIFDVDLSNLGRMQFDGLVRDDHKRLDLIVRSVEPLPREMQNDIRTIFEEANELTGVVGGLTFQAAPPNFVDIAPRGGPDDGSDLIA